MYVTYNVMGYHNSVSLQMQRLTMAETPSIALLQWLLQLLWCYRLVVIAVAAIFLPGTVSEVADVITVFIARPQVVVVGAERRRRNDTCGRRNSICSINGDKHTGNDGTDNSDDDSSDWQSNWCLTEFSCTSCVRHCSTTGHHCAQTTRGDISFFAFTAVWPVVVQT